MVDSIFSDYLSAREEFGDDNLDVGYPPPEFAVEPTELASLRRRYFDFVLEYSRRLETVFRQLSDDYSRSLLYSLILFRLLGYRKIRIAIDRAAYDRSRAASLAEPFSESVLDGIPGAQVVQHYEMETGGRVRLLDCQEANLFFTFFLRQYHLHRPNVTIAPEPGDYVVDAGACLGDTAIGFADAVGPSGTVYSFEVLQSHLDVFKYNLGQNPGLTNVRLLPFALGESDQAGAVAHGAVNPGFTVQPGRGAPPIRALDSLVAERTVQKVDFVKMDIEGSELAALRGSVETLRRFRPKLAISLYHRWEDYVVIPEFLAGLDLGYRFYLDHYTLTDGETVLYAAADRPGDARLTISV